MARVYISFLGTTNYLDCYYYHETDPTQPEPAYPVRFVQEATILQNCKDWGPGDEIVIFTTRAAEDANWLDGGHRKRDTGEALEGLQTRLQNLSRTGLQARFRNCPIPDGHTEEQVWEIFQIVYESLGPGSEVVFDITHAFRSIPLLAIVVLQYAKIIRGVTLRGIYYGAFEVLGNFEKARQIPLEERRAPIVELTALNSLMDWSIATDRFIKSGDVKSAATLAKTGVPDVKGLHHPNVVSHAIRDLGKSLERFGKMLSTCRGPEITSASLDLKNQVEKCRNVDLAKPFRPLFEMIRERLEAFSGDRLRDGLAAVRWCAEHNLIQQGFTILEEVLFSYVVARTGGDPLDVRMRDIASQASAIISKKIIDSQTKWLSPARDNPDVTVQMIAAIQQHRDFHKTVDRLRQLRNDLNHAGFCTNSISLDKADRFAQKLRELVDETEALFGEDLDA